MAGLTKAANAAKDAANQETTKRPEEGQSRSHRTTRTDHDGNSVLTAPSMPGYVLRYENDTDDNIERKLAMGYEVVPKNVKIGDRVAGEDSSLGRLTERNVGGGVKAVLLRIPVDLYEQRQRDKAAARKARLAGMKNFGPGSYEINKQDEA